MRYHLIGNTSTAHFMAKILFKISVHGKIDWEFGSFEIQQQTDILDKLYAIRYVTYMSSVLSRSSSLRLNVEWDRMLSVLILL